MPKKSIRPVIIEAHHHALPYWAELRNSLPEPPRLISFDHHTDTSKPFRNCLRRHTDLSEEEQEELRNEWLAEINYAEPKTVASALERLSNDEHIVTAIQTKILSAAHVVAHNAYTTSEAIYRQHRISCYAVDQKEQSHQLTRSECDQVLSSEFINGALAHWENLLAACGETTLLQKPYILDIDLDYINTHAALNPSCANTLQQLAENAHLITIATEPDFVKSCALDSDLNSESILHHLLNLLAPIYSLK